MKFAKTASILSTIGLFLSLSAVVILSFIVYNYRESFFATGGSATRGSRHKTRPRMIYDLRTGGAGGGSGGSGGSGDGVDESGASDSDVQNIIRWLRLDVNYLNKSVMPLKNYDDTSPVTKKDKCAPIASTKELFDETKSRAMYQCVEKGMLRVLPHLKKVKPPEEG